MDTSQLNTDTAVDTNRCSDPWFGCIYAHLYGTIPSLILTSNLWWLLAHESSFWSSMVLRYGNDWSRNVFQVFQMCLWTRVRLKVRLKLFLVSCVDWRLFSFVRILTTCSQRLRITWVSLSKWQSSFGNCRHTHLQPVEVHVSSILCWFLQGVRPRWVWVGLTWVLHASSDSLMLRCNIQEACLGKEVKEILGWNDVAHGNGFGGKSPRIAKLFRSF